MLTILFKIEGYKKNKTSIEQLKKIVLVIPKSFTLNGLAVVPNIHAGASGLAQST